MLIYCSQMQLQRMRKGNQYLLKQVVLQSTDCAQPEFGVVMAVNKGSLFSVSV